MIYYPPDRSKYHPIERCWAPLENYWNGAILDSVETALKWATNMTWKGITPMVHLVNTTDPTGIRPDPQELESSLLAWVRCSNLPKWDITILPA
ncbi:MAG: hypothetical protein SWY16_22130 [Cyanobacteriota bacterium]|nr:hypothetical protein [Cyanobacteriota bacterium]